MTFQQGGPLRRTFASLAAAVIVSLSWSSQAAADERPLSPQAAYALQSQDLARRALVKPRIIGGAPADEGEYPWAAALVISGAEAFGGQFCGGSLISPYFVLTAAHCVQNEDPSNIEVVVGRVDLRTQLGERIGVQRIIVHPDFNPVTGDSDLALLELKTASAATPVAVLDADLEAEPDAGAMTTVIGWGTTQFSSGSGSSDPSPELLEVTVPIVSQAECNEAYLGTITDNMICAGEEGKDACQGDSGGGLLFASSGELKLVGLVSFGEGCALADFPGVYTRLAPFRQWILENAVRSLESVSYFHWNGALDLHNIVTIYNRESSPVAAVARLLNGEGIEQSSLPFIVSGNRHVDLLVNLFPGFQVGGQGTVRLEYSALQLDANGFHYRLGAQQNAIEVMKGSALPRARTGAAYAIINSHQPSSAPADRDLPVQNWLELVNRDPAASRAFFVLAYDLSGAPAGAAAVSIPPQGRRDLEVSQLLNASQAAGMIEIMPADGAAEYSALLSRYGFRIAAGAPEPVFGTAIEPRGGDSAPVYASITSAAGAFNWLIAANTGSTAGSFRLELYSGTGGLAAQLELELPPHASSHVLASAHLPPGESGIAKLVSGPGSTGLLESAVYFPELSGSGGVSAAYAAAGRPPGTDEIFGSYNLALAQFNWLKAFNLNGGSPAPLTATAYAQGLNGGVVLVSIDFELLPHASRDLGLHQLGISLAEGSSGLFSLAAAGADLLGSLQRVQYGPDGTVRAAELLELR